MGKRLRISIFAGLILIAALLFTATRSREPVYQGKKLSAWLEKLYSGYSPEEGSAELELAIRQMGTNTLPFLLSRLRSKNSRIKLKIDELARKQDFINIQFHDNNTDRYTAVVAFQFLGPMARPAMPALVEMLNDTDICYEVAYALGAIGPEAIPALTNTWTQSNSTIRTAGFRALVSMGTNAETALPFLIAALQDTDSYIRRGAADSMFYVGTNRPALAIPALIKTLDDPDLKVRRVTIRSLGSFTSKAQTAVPKLTELLGQREWSGSAAMTLVSIIGTNRSIPLITKALTNEDKRVRVTLIQILGSFQSESREAIPALLPFTRDEDENLRNPAIQALIKIGAESEVMIPLLVDELADTASMIRGDVLSALAAFGAEAKAAVPVLLEQIEVLIKNGGQFPVLENSAFQARYGALRGSHYFAPSHCQEFKTLRQIDPAAADKIKKHFEKEKAETAKKKK